MGIHIPRVRLTRRLLIGVAAAAVTLAVGCTTASGGPDPTTSRSSPDAGSGAPGPARAPCNGSPHLCALRYDQVTYPATHDAFAYAAGGPVKYQFPNQDRPITDQLVYGIRTLGIRPCPYFGTDPGEQGRVYITHNSALKGALGTEPLADVLGEVRTFLEGNPHEVITLLAESSVTPAEVAATFQIAGLVPYLYTHDAAKGWPTLGEMIARGTRLVVFNDSQEPSRPAWQHYMWDYIADTDYNITSPDQFSCKIYRGKPANDLYFINQFIYVDLGSGVVVPDKAKAAVANDEQLAFARSVACWRETGRIPNFVYVDWYGQGNVRGVARCLNALPRTAPAADAACSGGDGGAPSAGGGPGSGSNG
jgi:hypothetical protein